MEHIMLHRASVAFPLQHTFVDANHCGDRTRYLIRANMTKFVAFLSESVEMRACPFRAIRTTKNRDLRPLSDYVTIAVDVSGAGERTYKYAEGCWNLVLTDKGWRCHLISRCWRSRGHAPRAAAPCTGGRS
jgi:hypothetical protein